MEGREGERTEGWKQRKIENSKRGRKVVNTVGIKKEKKRGRKIWERKEEWKKGV